MAPRWLAVLGCLCILMTVGQSATVPSQDTLVVTVTGNSIDRFHRVCDMTYAALKQLLGAELAKLKTSVLTVTLSLSLKPEILEEIEKFYGQLYTATQQLVYSTAEDPRDELTRHYTENISDVILHKSTITAASEIVKNGVMSEMTTDELTTEMTTEEPNVPIKLIEMDVRSEVSMRYAHTAVVTRMRNAARRAQEATFRLLLPETAFISGFTMILDGKPYKAYVKGKEEAKKIYTQAVSQGFGAAHIATKARDSNHFTVSVNVEPNTTVVFNLTYEELLVRRNSVYNHAINLHPGALVPKLKVTVHIKEGQKITQLRVPEVRTGNEIDATDNDTQISKAVITRSQNEREATITFEPDVNEQIRLMDIYAEKSRDSQVRVSETDEYKQKVLGQFVVQYDVDRPKDGEILVDGGYFVHFFAPKSLSPLSKHVVFVLDTSGSMLGRNIEQLREAMKTILGELNPGDYFNIVEFASSVKVYDLKEAAEPGSINNYWSWDPVILVPPSPATPENVEKAKIIVSRLQPRDLTNIVEALKTAVDLINNGVALPQLSTDNSATSTQAPPPDNQETSAATNLQDIPANNEEVSKLEPVIIFLTDGQPNVGESSPERIFSIISEKNSGANKASIFSLSFGASADRDFLRKLSLRNDGFMRNIYEASDAALQLRDFYRQVASPLLADVNFVYPPEQVETATLTKHQFRTLYAGSEMVVAGRVSGARLLAPQVVATCAVGELDNFRTKRYEASPRVAIPVNTNSSSEEYLPLERLWAYLSIKQLLDERDAAVSQTDQENSPEKKALAIALKYEFVTPLTSLVVVKPNDTNNAVDAESVDRSFSGQYAAQTYGSGPGYGPMFAGTVPAGGQYASQAYGSGAGYGPVSAGTVPAGSVPLGQITSSYPSPYGLPGSSSFNSGFSSGSSPSYPSYTGHSISDPVVLLREYHLQGYDWVLMDLVSGQGAIEIPPQTNYVNHPLKLELSKDAIAPRDPLGDAACARSTAGGAGVCVYLTRCEPAKRITKLQYQQTYCVVNTRYAGVCCPRDGVTTLTLTTTYFQGYYG